MSQQINRIVKLSVGPRGAPNALLIEKLRIVFKVEQTLEKTPNSTQIEVYNLSESSRSQFEKKGAAVSLDVGYQDNVGNLFVGDIASVTTKRTGADIITSIEAVDSLQAYQNGEADLSFSPGTTVGVVLDKLLSAIGISKGEIQGLNLGDQYLNGASFSGKIRDHLDALLGKQKNLSWSIQNGQVQILPKNGASVYPAVLLTPKTGLVGSPFKRVVVNQDIVKNTTPNATENGCVLKALLNRDLSPGRLVRVESQFVKGTFKIGKATHSGDTHAISFYSDLETVEV